MERKYHPVVWLLMGVLGLGFVGCQRDGATENPRSTNPAAKSKSHPQSDAEASAKAGASAKSNSIRDENVKPATHVVVVTDQAGAWEDDGPPRMPNVVMTEHHAASCLVKVGQTLPDVTLMDLEGRQQQLSKLLGQRLTVVVMWSSSNIHAPGELNDLAVEVASPMAARGVRVVGINERDSPETAKNTAETAGVAFPVLLDVEGKFFAQVATERLPRTYLLDASGKILWLDIEYSRITHHDLRQAIRFALDGT